MYISFIEKKTGSIIMIDDKHKELIQEYRDNDEYDEYFELIK